MIYANNEHFFLCYSVIIATIYPDFTIPFRYPCLTTVLFSRSLDSCHRSYARFGENDFPIVFICTIQKNVVTLQAKIKIVELYN